MSLSTIARVLRFSPKVRLPWNLTDTLEFTVGVTQPIYLDLKPSLFTLQSISIQDPAQIVQQKQITPTNTDETLCAEMPVLKEKWIQHRQKNLSHH